MRNHKNSQNILRHCKGSSSFEWHLPRRPSLARSLPPNLLMESITSQQLITGTDGTEQAFLLPNLPCSKTHISSHKEGRPLTGWINTKPCHTAEHTTDFTYEYAHTQKKVQRITCAHTSVCTSVCVCVCVCVCMCAWEREREWRTNGVGSDRRSMPLVAQSKQQGAGVWKVGEAVCPRCGWLPVCPSHRHP